MNMKTERGMVLVVALFFAVILYAVSGIFILATVNEEKSVRAERKTAEAFYAAHGGANEALIELDTLINDYLLNTIADSYPSGVISYATSKVSDADGIGWLVYAVRDNNVPVLTQDGDEAEYSGAGELEDLDYAYEIVMTEKGDPVAVTTDEWSFPFGYTISATGTSGNKTAKVSINGDFTVQLQKDSFAKYALFTNDQTTESGSRVWFTDKTDFDGPVHTNGRFNFALNPSGTFEEIVSQQETTARFYNNGWSVLLDDDHNGTRDVPVFNDDFERGADEVTLDSPVEASDMVDQATGGDTFGTDGIYVPNNGTSLTGGIYVRGNSDIVMSVDGSDRPVYTITQGATTQQITVDAGAGTTSIYDNASGSTTTYAGIPDGTDDVGTLIYVDGAIDSLEGTVQADSQLTIGSEDDITISDNILYEDYTPANGSPGDADYTPPSAEGTDNLLGIVSWTGDVAIGTPAPDDVQIHGTVLASDGVFQVDNYNNQGVGPRGTATLLGGVISDNYGAFGLFNGSTGAQLSGYGRNFVYDERMRQGQTPPYFPTLDTFIAFTNDITDKMVWQEGE